MATEAVDTKMNKMCRLSEKQLGIKLDFINSYINAENASEGSKFDPNSNVTSKNIATMLAELNKDINIQIKRALVKNKMKQLWGQNIADNYEEQLEKHEIYCHDETAPMPYTYSAKEVSVFIYNNETLLTSFEDLYDIVDINSVCVDEDKGVWCKYPKNLYVLDKEGKTKVTVLTKKIRHRDLVRVKTSFGEDIVVTDNHPMIVSNDYENTVEAKDCLGEKQYRIDSKLSSLFLGQTKINLNLLSPYNKEQYTHYYVSQVDSNHKTINVNNVINVDRTFGYVVGFFIGDGNYCCDSNGDLLPYLHFTQKEKETLKNIADIIGDYTNAIPTIRYKEDKSNCWTLDVFCPDLVYLFHNIFGIKHKSQQKTLPINIFNYTKEFALGIIEGLIDSDGSVINNRTIQIRLASRTAIQQLSLIARALGFTGGNHVQNTPFGNNKKITTNYTIWGFTFSVTKNSPLLTNSYKAYNAEIVDKSIKYSRNTWATISSVDKIGEGSFLDDNKYIYDITTESHTFMCNGLWTHNCVAISMYPFLTDGLKAFGGEAKAPKHLSSYNGEFSNLIFAVSSQFCGAVATVEYLVYFDHFARKDYGANYLEDYENIIKQELQQTIYTLNQPASARGNQSPFWNISIFDKNYFDALFGNFYFPDDGTQPVWESVNKLQKYFMHWFNKERTKALLTFPVVTVSMLNDHKEIIDKEYEELVTRELSEGNSFFVYTSDTVDSLSSCCFKGDEIIKIIRSDGNTVETTIKDYVESKSTTPYIDAPIDTDDKILSYCPDTDDFEEVYITGILKKKYEGKLISIKVNKEIVKTTPDHIFLVKNKGTDQLEEKTAQELLEEYLEYKILVNVNGMLIYKNISLVHESSSEHTCPVYDIQLERNHYFFANGILTHNCRLRNSIADQLNDFSYSLGAGGIMTGSMNVLTLNMNRFIQNAVKKATTELNLDIAESFDKVFDFICSELKEQIKLMHKYQIAFKILFKEFQDAHMLPAYEAHFIELDKQYLTIGINGIMEGLEFLNFEPTNNTDYKQHLGLLLKVIADTNRETCKKYENLKLKINTECVPAENLGVKFAKWDRKDGYKVTRDCYNSYFYPVEDDNLSVLDKISMHGRETTGFCDGGTALHLNLEEYPTQETFKKLLDCVVQEGCPYFCTNVKVTICNCCDNIDKRTLSACPKCGSTDVDYATRVIG